MQKDFVKDIFLSFAPVALVAGLGSLFSQMGMEWYDQLQKPDQWLPNFVIPLIWSVIYVVGAIIIFRLLQTKRMETSLATLFIINGVLNVLWCLVFFTLRQRFLAMIIITTNAIFAWLLLGGIFKRNKLFAGLLLIYPIWLNIATTLNLATWTLN